MTKKIADADLNVAKRSFAAMFGIFLSRCSGVVRVILINAFFGAQVTLDAFNTAFRFPNSLRDLFADGALSAAFMKTLIDERLKGAEEERELIRFVIGFFFTVTLILALLGIFFAKPFISLISPKAWLTGSAIILATHLFQILIFYLPLTMLNAVVMALLGVHNMNFRAMNSSIFLSVGMLSMALLLAPLCHYWHVSAIYGLAYGALFGAILQLIYQSIPLFPFELFRRPCFNPKAWFHFKPLREVLWLMTPRMLGQGATTLALMINTFFALHLGHGTMTYVATTVTIIQVPIGLFGVATGFASLPVLTQTINQKDYAKFSQLFVDGLQLTLWFSLLTIIAIVIFVIPGYHVIFQHGKIHYTDSIKNGLLICAYSSGILFSTCSKVLVSALYALNRAWFIAYNSLLYLIVSAFFTFYLTPKFGLIGLGIAFGLGSAANFWLNYFLIYHAYTAQHYSTYPFAAAGRFFKTKLGLYSIASFFVSLLGILFIAQFWQKYEYYMGKALDFKTAFAIDFFGGILFTLITILITLHIGPPATRALTKRYCEKLFRFLRKGS